MLNGPLFEDNQDEKFHALVNSMKAQSQAVIVKYGAFSAISAISLWVLYLLKRKRPNTETEESLIDQIGE
ncbi:MAG: hypothetical protein R8P61_05735 [Bacteroidia bacterium]|nr:hypothetical protein [Bacteroidia bacterium]